MLALVVATLLTAECEANVDCAGTLVCVEHVCTSPPPLPPLPSLESLTPPPLPPPFELEQPNACAEPLDADGRLKKECVVPVQSAPRTKKRAASSKKQRAQPMGTIAFLGGPLIAAERVLPSIALTGSGGVLLPSGLGPVGMFDAKILVGRGGVGSLFTVGGGLRFGRKTHATIAIGASLTSLRVGRTGYSGFTFAAMAEVGVVIGEYFTLVLHPTVDFGPTLVVGMILGGLGVSF